MRRLSSRLAGGHCRLGLFNLSILTICVNTRHSSQITHGPQCTQSRCPNTLASSANAAHSDLHDSCMLNISATNKITNLRILLESLRLREFGMLFHVLPTREQHPFLSLLHFPRLVSLDKPAINPPPASYFVSPHQRTLPSSPSPPQNTSQTPPSRHLSRNV